MIVGSIEQRILAPHLTGPDKIPDQIESEIEEHQKGTNNIGSDEESKK